MLRKDYELINIPMHRDFVAMLTEKLPSLGYSNRSDFFRRAIAEKLKSEAIDVPVDWITAPTRIKFRSRVTITEAVLEASHQAGPQTMAITPNVAAHLKRQIAKREEQPNRAKKRNVKASGGD